MFFLDEEHGDFVAKIKVVGVGGGGCNAINSMMEAGLKGIEFIAINTDVQALSKCQAPNRLQIGIRVSKGLGVGANPETGMRAAHEDEDSIKDLLAGADMVFVTCGLGGGTGTGAAPVVAKLAREMGALTVGVVTKPFVFEGGKRMRRAEEGLLELKKYLDSIIIIPNQKLITAVDKSTSLLAAFKMVDDILRQAIQGIADLILIPGLVNVDFADVKAVMSTQSGGRSVMGTGTASGKNRAEEAANNAISSSLLEEGDINGATAVLINITGGSDVALHEISTISMIIQEAADSDSNIIMGSVIDSDCSEGITVTVIATGFNEVWDDPVEPVVDNAHELPIAEGVKELFPKLGRPKPKLRRESKIIDASTAGYDNDKWDTPTYIRNKREI